MQCQQCSSFSTKENGSDMRLNLQFLTVITLAIALGLSFPICSQAGQGKKTETSAGTKTTQKTKINWKQEPSSFLNIRFSEALNSSVWSACPKKADEHFPNGLVDETAIEAMPEGSHCYLVEDGHISIRPIRIPPLWQVAQLSTDNGSITGTVENIDIGFNTSDFKAIKSLFTSKFGEPHKQTTEKVKTEEGAEFDKQVLDWQGKNVSIHVVSIVEGEVSNTTDQHGMISISTNSYIDVR
jgi:hypothetical protein